MGSMPRLLGALLCCVALALCLAPALAQPQFPILTGRVVDDAGLLSPSQRMELESELKALEDKGSDQLVVVTLPSLQGYPIEDYGYRLGRHWGIGTGELDNGVLLIVAPNERKVRIEVGRGLEPILTDALSKVIIETSILPRFRAGDFPGGIMIGARDIGRVLTGDSAELEARRNVRRDADAPPVDWFMVLFWIIIIISFIHIMRQNSLQSGRRGGAGSVFIPGSGSRGKRSGGGRGGGGGGFSGGGGGFGGGGASGSW